MSDFTEAAREFLTRFGIPKKCKDCGNTNLDELAITGSGQLICRQDDVNVRSACVTRNGWRVLGPDGQVVSTGPGITFNPTSLITE